MKKILLEREKDSIFGWVGFITSIASITLAILAIWLTWGLARDSKDQLEHVRIITENKLSEVQALSSKIEGYVGTIIEQQINLIAYKDEVIERRVEDTINELKKNNESIIITEDLKEKLINLEMENNNLRQQSAKYRSDYEKYRFEYSIRESSKIREIERLQSTIDGLRNEIEADKRILDLLEFSPPNQDKKEYQKMALRQKFESWKEHLEEETKQRTIQIEKTNTPTEKLKFFDFLNQ